MYVFVQTCGKIIIAHPGVTSYYRTLFNGRRLFVPSSQSQSSQYRSNQKNAYNQKHHYLQTFATSDGRKLMVPLPVPIIQYPLGGVSSTSYNAASHSASAAAHRNQAAYNYQQVLRRTNDEDEDLNEVQAVPTCDNHSVNVATEESEPEMIDFKVVSDGDKYRKEMCLYISPKMNSLLSEMSPETTEEFINDFVTVVDKYCDFANLEE